MVANFERGDIVYVQMNPTKGREQAGKRPALVLSSTEYNKKCGMAIVCPITSQIKGYPYEVKLQSKTKTQGVVLCDQVRLIDFRSPDRDVSFVEHCDEKTLFDVVDKLAGLIGY